VCVSQDWEFATELPEWAQPEFDDSELIDKVRPTEATVPWQDDELGPDAVGEKE